MRRNILIFVGILAFITLAAPAGERPPVKEPRATSGDTAVEPDWAQKLTITVGPKDDDDLPCWLQVIDLSTGAPLEHVKITAELGIDQAISYTDEHGYSRIEGLKTQMRLLQLDSFGYSSVFLDTEVGHERAERA